MFQEYPKALYQGGSADAEMRLATDKEQEDALRAEGFRSIGEEEKRKKAKT